MSKFLRRMSDLSRRPEDYHRPTVVDSSPEEPPTVRVSTVPLPGDLPTVGFSIDPPRLDPPTVVRPTPTRPHLPTVGSSSRTSFNPRARVFQAEFVQDAHTHGEQAVYEMLWSLASPDPADPERRSISIGYDRLAKAVRANEKTVRNNIKTLIQKRSLEIAAAENSSTRQGKTYLIYSYPRILERRTQAGMAWVIKNRGVKFIAPDETPTVGRRLPPTVVYPPTVPKTPTVEPSAPPTVGPSFSDPIAEAALRHGVILDQHAIRKLRRRCMEFDSAASDQEIAHFTLAKLLQLRDQPSPPQNLVGLLLASVPLYFSAPSPELEQLRSATAASHPVGSFPR